VDEAGLPELLVLADDSWEGPKRARHKIPRALARLGHRTLWVESDVCRRLAGRGSPQLRAVEPGLFVAPTPIIRRSHYGRNPLRRWREPIGIGLSRWTIRQHCRHLDLKPDWVLAWQDPSWANELAHHRAQGRTTAYFASDLLNDFSGRDLGAERLQAICRQADAVFCTSQAIADHLRDHHEEVHVVPHGLDLELWSAPAPSVPPDLASIPQPRLVFAGVATVKFDVDLWERLARRRPDWQLVVVGPIDAALNEVWPRLERRPNVHVLGYRPLEALPGYLHHADVLAMPYRRDPVRIHSGLPNKFYEYLASGRPILSTPFTEFEDVHPNLRVAAGEEWESQLNELEQEPSRVPDLRAHDYAERARLVASVLERCKARAGRSQGPG
jgi:glycosyltransferase involved in cell wall biosynthesis